MGNDLLGAHADRVSIGACNPMLCPIWGFRGNAVEWTGCLDSSDPAAKDTAVQLQTQTGAVGAFELSQASLKVRARERRM